MSAERATGRISVIVVVAEATCVGTAKRGKVLLYLSRSLEKEAPRSTRYRDYEDRYGGGGRHYRDDREYRHGDRYPRNNYHSRSPERYGRSHRYEDRHRR